MATIEQIRQWVWEALNPYPPATEIPEEFHSAVVKAAGFHDEAEALEARLNGS